MRGFSTMDSGQGERRGAEGSAAWTANGEGELYGVQHRGQREGKGSCTGFRTVHSGQGGREEYGVQHHG